MTDYQRMQIRLLYPSHSGAEIARLIGMKKNAVNGYANRQGLHHTPEAWKEIRKGVAKKMLQGKTPQSWKKSAKTRRRTYKREMFRLLGGQKKQTNITISILSDKCRRRMIMLCNVYNYFRDPDINKAVVYYDKETRRNSAAELYARQTYGIKFIQADE